MADVCQAVAEYLADALHLAYGKSVFYYQLPEEVNECLVVQRVQNNISIPVQIDASVHSLRIAARCKTSDAAYNLAFCAYCALNNVADETVHDEPGFIVLNTGRAAVRLYDYPAYDSQDQQGRKVFHFFATLIASR